MAFWRSHGIWEFAATYFSKALHEEFFLFSVVPTMSEEWGKFAQILEREEQEFRRAMQEEVSIISILLSLVVHIGILTGAGIITQHKKEL